MKHLYLFTLEIAPLEVGMTYNDLPSHLTLMSRFLAAMSPPELSNVVLPLFDSTEPLTLLFGETIALGPKKLLVHMVHQAREAKLHHDLRIVLNAANVEYQYPQFIGDSHKAHVTAREGVIFKPGDKHITEAAYLIEVVDGKRIVRTRFNLRGNRAVTTSASS